MADERQFSLIAACLFCFCSIVSFVLRCLLLFPGGLSWWSLLIGVDLQATTVLYLCLFDFMMWVMICVSVLGCLR